VRLVIARVLEGTQCFRLPSPHMEASEDNITGSTATAVLGIPPGHVLEVL
jgi:hypothetical protein